MATVKASGSARQDNFRVQVKKRLIELDMTVTELAEKTGHSRTAVSQAINYEMHSGVIAAIKKVLEL